MAKEQLKPIRVMLVDDHTMVRRGLATFLKVFDDLVLAGEAENGETAIQICEEVIAGCDTHGYGYAKNGRCGSDSGNPPKIPKSTSHCVNKL